MVLKFISLWRVTEASPKVDWFIFFLGAALLSLVVLPIVVFPEASQALIDQAFRFITRELGVLYVALATSILVFLIYAAAGPWGRVRLGDGDARYSQFSWISMLFCCGIGGSVIYWGASEWVFYYVAPPFSTEPESDAATLWATTYGMFHWGPVGWALYCLPTLAISCAYYLGRSPSLRLSAACEAGLGRFQSGGLRRFIDLLFIVGLLSSAATGLGFGTAVATSALTRLAGIPDNFSTQLALIAVITVLISISVYRGLDDGIKTLSNINSVLALVLLACVFVLGPTLFIAETSLAALGHGLQHFIQMLTWTDPLGRDQFVENWTVFYWAWWLALGPFVGMFVCKISEGRTVRELITGMLLWGSLGCALFFMILGNFSLNLELTGQMNVVEESQSMSPSYALSHAVTYLPGASLWLIFVAVIGTIFTATTYDSAAYTLAAGATQRLAPGQHPERWHRVFWALALGMLPASLLYLGSLRALQTATIVASVPLLVIYVILMISITRTLRSAS